MWVPACLVPLVKMLPLRRCVLFAPDAPPKIIDCSHHNITDVNENSSSEGQLHKAAQDQLWYECGWCFEHTYTVIYICGTLRGRNGGVISRFLQ